jgi:positive regulator of sigma E activity
MVYCSECGEEVSADAAFCQECGAELAPQETPKTESTTDVESEADIEHNDTGDGIEWRLVGAAILLGLFPAFGAYVGVSIAAFDAVGIVFVIALPVFAYLLYQRPTVKAMAGGMFFWLSIETFLTPVMLLIYTFVFASQTPMTGAGQAGAAIGGIILVVVAFVVGVPVGVVFYLLSSRLDTDKEQLSSEPTETQSSG